MLLVLLVLLLILFVFFIFFFHGKVQIVFSSIKRDHVLMRGRVHHEEGGVRVGEMGHGMRELMRMVLEMLLGLLLDHSLMMGHLLRLRMGKSMGMGRVGMRKRKRMGMRKGLRVEMVRELMEKLLVGSHSFRGHCLFFLFFIIFFLLLIFFFLVFVQVVFKMVVVVRRMDMFMRR